jgi:hypothetical protein
LSVVTLSSRTLPCLVPTLSPLPSGPFMPHTWRCRHSLSDVPTYCGGPSPWLHLTSRCRCGRVGSFFGVSPSCSTPHSVELHPTAPFSACYSSPLPRRRSSLPVGGCGSLFRWLLASCCFSLLSRHGLHVVFPSESYLLSPKVCCVELDLELGKSLARSLSVLTTTAFPNVVYSAWGSKSIWYAG